MFLHRETDKTILRKKKSIPDKCPIGRAHVFLEIPEKNVKYVGRKKRGSSSFSAVWQVRMHSAAGQGTQHSRRLSLPDPIYPLQLAISAGRPTHRFSLFCREVRVVLEGGGDPRSKKNEARKRRRHGGACLLYRQEARCVGWKQIVPYSSRHKRWGGRQRFDTPYKTVAGGSHFRGRSATRAKVNPEGRLREGVCLV